jgi:hypothetical protein
VEVRLPLKRKDKSNSQGTVLDDITRDSLLGGLGSDWFFNFTSHTTDYGLDDR